MAGSYSRLMLGFAPWDFPRRSPGTCGINDAGAPGTSLYFLGDTPGSVGLNDGAAPAAPLATPPPPNREDVLAAAAEFLIKEEACPEHPYWPKGQSGITWGVGWDASQQTVLSLESDWGELPKLDLEKLRTAIGPKNAGEAAQKLLPTVVKIRIPPEVSLAVFRTKTLPAYYRRMTKAFPGADLLAIEVQVALVSLVYNRGARMKDRDEEKEDRREMRAIRNAVHEGDLFKIADELRKMERLWVGTNIEKGMRRRRESEAGMVERAIKASPAVEPPILLGGVHWT